MARPLKPKTLDSFPHPCGRDYWDHRLATFELMYGSAGYAFYYKVLEMVYQQEGCILILDDDTRRVLLARLKLRPEKFDDMLEVALKTRLFDPDAYRDSRLITSASVRAVAASAFAKRDRERGRYRRKSGARTTPETARTGALTNRAPTQCVGMSCSG